ncbi:hypothetical protein [Pseudomonas sp. NFR16]|uniref:hypothetical protein n=1 Tax=Pseudomonas sp. NFR16 TaxID=1566248 RepID=UPI0008C6E6B6|nr:hypothetical protein [Pseudomonas sp. NFR16]SEJ95337.1 hypothetical protein SAMN03159495_5476 [Pseudomonas sp. NFR16]
MIYLGDSKVDFSDAGLVKFVQSENTGGQWSWPLPEFSGYTKSPVPAFGLGGAISNIDVPWSVIQYWVLLDKGQEISVFKIATSASRKVDVKADIVLFLQDGLNQDAKERIEKAFRAYSLSMGDVDRYAQDFIKSNPDISPFAFGCAKTCSAEIVSDEFRDTTQEDFIRLRLKEDYRIRLLREEQRSRETRPVRGPNELVCPEDKEFAKAKRSRPHNSADVEIEKQKNKILQQCDSLKSIEDDMSKRRERSRCDNEILVWQVATSPALPASRWEWGWHTVKVGCVSFDLYYPQFQLCDQEYHLIIAISVPKTILMYEKSIRDCAQDSALSAVVITVVFTDLNAGLVAFKTLFWRCLKNKFVDQLPCLDGEVYVETILVGDWH